MALAEKEGLVSYMPDWPGHFARLRFFWIVSEEWILVCCSGKVWLRCLWLRYFSGARRIGIASWQAWLLLGRTPHHQFQWTAWFCRAIWHNLAKSMQNLLLVSMGRKSRPAQWYATRDRQIILKKKWHRESAIPFFFTTLFPTTVINIWTLRCIILAPSHLISEICSEIKNVCKI